LRQWVEGAVKARNFWFIKEEKRGGEEGKRGEKGMGNWIMKKKVEKKENKGGAQNRGDEREALEGEGQGGRKKKEVGQGYK